MIVRRVLGGLLVLAAVTLAWGAGVAPRLVAERHITATLPRLPAALDGARVAFLSDLQVGMRLANTDTARRIVARLVADPPAAALLGGDFLYSADPDPRVQVAAVVDFVAPLPRAGIPTYAVLGNHDLRSGAAPALRRALEAAGITVLGDEAAAVPRTAAAGRPALHVVGLRPDAADVERPAAALARHSAAFGDVPVDAPRVVVMHDPASFRALPPGTAPFAVAGHTHCGQIRLPFPPHWTLAGALESFDDVPLAGWAPEGYGAPGNALYVSCGVGFSFVPVRLGARPELTIATLRDHAGSAR